MQRPKRPRDDETPEEQAARHRLVTENLGLAGAVVAKVIGGRRDREDLMSEATLGLCQASLSYDEKQSKFSTFGSYGAFYSVSYYIKREHKHRRLLLECDAPAGCEIDSQPDPDSEDVTPDRIKAERLAAIRGAMVGLSAREVAIIEAWLDGQTLEAIGRLFGITKERVRQIKANSFERIRAALKQAAVIS